MLFIIFPFKSFGQNLEILFDYSIFKYNSDSTLVELYYSLLDTTLNYKQIDDLSMMSRLNFQATLTHRQKGIKERVTWDYSQTKKIVDSNLIYSLFGVQKIILPRGEYKIEIICKDEYNQVNSRTFEDEIKIIIFGTEKPMLSMLQLAGIIELESNKTQNWNQMFQKGSLFVLPNPTLEYTSDNPNLLFYFETYNIKESKSELQYFLTILDGAKREVFKTSVPVRKIAEDHGRHFSVPLDLLPTGVYYLRLSLVKNEMNEVLDEASKKFYFYNQFISPQLTANFSEDQLFEMSEFSAMNLDKVDYEYRKLRAIARPIEIEQWGRLTELIGKQRFLYRFWAMRDEDTTTILNEAKMQFEENVVYANTFFTYGKNKEGWNTDRGRVLLKYGIPTVIDRIPQNGTERPYETWTYDEIQGGIAFNFVDVMGFGNYILVNSNALGEIKNQRWFQDYVQNKKSTGYPQNEDNFNINR